MAEKLSSRDLLELCLAPTTTDRKLAAALRKVVSQKLREDDYVEFKDGKILALRKELAEQARKAVCGFANADGGTLIFGVAEERNENGQTSCAESFAPCTDAKAAGRAPETIATAVSIVNARPIIREANVDGARVIVVAVPRSLPLLDYYVEGRLRCYRRIGPTTQPLSESHRLDLVLGRRERSSLSLSFASHSCVEPKAEFAVHLLLSNASLVWAENIRVGVVGYRARLLPGSDSRLMGPELAKRVDVHESQQRPVLAHCTLDLGRLGPLDVHEFAVGIPCHTIEGGSDPRATHRDWKGPPAEWSGAIYMTAPTAGVALYSLQVSYSAECEIMSSRKELVRDDETRPAVFWGLKSLWKSPRRRSTRVL